MDHVGTYLAVDFGTAKVGVAVGSLIPSTPLSVVRYTKLEALLQQLGAVAQQEQAEGVVIGWPADHLAISTPQTEAVRRFGDQLHKLTRLPVIYYPETLTTQLALRRMIAAGISKQRRPLVEDSYAAAAILDDYLESLH